MEKRYGMLKTTVPVLYCLSKMEMKKRKRMREKEDEGQMKNCETWKEKKDERNEEVWRFEERTDDC